MTELGVTFAARCLTCTEEVRTPDYSEREDFIYLHRDSGHQVTYQIEK